MLQAHLDHRRGAAGARALERPGRIMKILDAGAYGVICPMINTREEAEALVPACKYPPHGYRSFGPVRASIYGGADYAEHANETLIVMPMIETTEAVKNIDEILSVPGIDAVYVGPSDLSLSLGCSRAGPDRAAGRRGPEQILAACERPRRRRGHLHNATPRTPRR